ncbi:MAG TPA: transglutaminase family protein [Acidimicrobiales bacterium]|nr:transglutaminase family protein [Acidimicrobiales bacterium]
MFVRVGCEFRHTAGAPTPSVWQVRPRRDGPHRLVDERWEVSPACDLAGYLDLFGNRCDRLTLPVGSSVVRYDAVAEVAGTVDDADPDAPQLAVEDLPDETLVHLLPSRLCFPELLAAEAWALFGSGPVGWRRVQAVCDWVHDNVRYDDADSTPATTALDVWERRAGVCRDFAQLAITFCRSLNIPARYVFGYLPDVGVPPPDYPMDFCAWFEAHLGGRWWTFDPRNNQRRAGRVVIGRGRDAVDVAMLTTYGAPVLDRMTVWADEVGSPTLSDADAGAGDRRAG